MGAGGELIVGDTAGFHAGAADAGFAVAGEEALDHPFGIVAVGGFGLAGGGGGDAIADEEEADFGFGIGGEGGGQAEGVVGAVTGTQCT